MSEPKVVIWKVSCCATCEFGFMKLDGLNVFVACSMHGYRHPGELCEQYEED